MAEKQKESSSYGQVKEKEALLDMDTGKDLLTSSKSMAEDAQMDFDFSTVAKGNKKPFKSDNMFDDFNFKSSLGKIPKEANAKQDVEPSPSLSGSLGFGTCIGAPEGDTTSKFDSQLGGEPNSLSKEKSRTSLTDVHLPSKLEIAKDQATNLGATTSPQKPIAGSTQETYQDNCQSERTTQQEPYKETCQNSSLQSVPENSSIHQTARNSTEEVGCFARKESANTDGERSISGEKTDFGFNCGNLHLDKLPADIACSQSNNGEHSQFSGDKNVCIDSNDDAKPTQSGIQFEQTSTTTASKKMLHEIETDGETMDVTSELLKPSNTMETIIETTLDEDLLGSKRVTTVTSSKYIKGSDEAKLRLQQSSVSRIKSATFDSKMIKTFQLSPADEGATMGDKAMQIMESLPIIRSESFEGLDETRSQLRQASSSQVKVGTVSSQKITISQQSTATEKKPDKKYAQTRSKSGDLPRPGALPKEQTGAKSVEIKSQKSSSNLISKRGSLNSDGTRNHLTNRTRLQDMEVAKRGPVPDRSGSEDLNEFSETTGDQELPGSKRVTTVTSSKYIKGSDEAKLHLQQSSVCRTKAATFDSKRIETFQLSPVDEGATMGDKAMQIMESIPIIRKPDMTYAQTGSKLADLSRPSALPKEQTNAKSVEIKSQKSSSNLISKRGSLNSDGTRNHLTNRTRLQDMEVAKGGPVPDGSGSEDLNEFSETTGDIELPGSKWVTTVTSSKYIKGSDEAKLQLQQSSVSRTKAATFDSKRIGTFQLSPVDEGATMGDKAMQIMESIPIIRKPDKKYAQTGSKLADLPRSSALPKEQTRAKSVEIKSQNSSSNLISKRGSLNSDGTRNHLTNRKRLQDMEVAKGGPVPDGSEDLNKFSMLDKEKERERPEKDVECFRECIRSEFKGVDDTVYDIRPKHFFLERFHDALKANTTERIKDIVAVSDGILIFRMMLRGPCRRISAEVKKFEAWCADHDWHPIPPSVIYKHGVALDHFGLDRMIGQLVKEYLQPIINVFFGFVGEIDHHFSFCVEFGAKKHNHIDLNYKDNSDITAKLFLSGVDCTGADLQFGETRCLSHESASEQPPLNTVILETGHVAMHCGRHCNGISPIEETNEYAPKQYIIIWMKRLNVGHPECGVCRRLAGVDGSVASSSKKRRKRRT